MGSGTRSTISALCLLNGDLSPGESLNIWPKTVWSDVDQNGDLVAYPDTFVGTDSHTTMVNGAAVLGWGAGECEAEAGRCWPAHLDADPRSGGVSLTGRDA